MKGEKQEERLKLCMAAACVGPELEIIYFWEQISGE